MAGSLEKQDLDSLILGKKLKFSANDAKGKMKSNGLRGGGP
jgi:hypothetical protein